MKHAFLPVVAVLMKTLFMVIIIVYTVSHKIFLFNLVGTKLVLETLKHIV